MMSEDHSCDDEGAKRRSPDEFSADPLADKIGKALRKSYEDVVKEGIPDDFLELLKTADQRKGA